MTAPKVSILLPVYNGARFLDTTLQCLVDQTYPDFEIVALDDGSWDNSWEVLEKWAAKDGRIRLVRHPANKGVYEAQRRLAMEARGEYLAQQDQDDPSAPNRLEVQVALLDTHPAASGIVSDVWLLDEEGDAIGVTSIPKKPEDLAAAMRHQNVCWHSSLLMRRSAFEACGGYREEAGHVADYDLLLRLLKVGPLIPAPMPLATYGLSPGTVTYRDRKTQGALAAQIRHRHFGDPAPARTIFEPVSPDEARASYHREVGRMYLAKGHMAKARSNLKAAADTSHNVKDRLWHLASLAPAALVKLARKLKGRGRASDPEFFLKRNNPR